MKWLLGTVAFLVAAVGFLVTAGCYFCLYLAIRDDRRLAKRVRDLKAETPDHDHTGGPTQYDEQGRVTF